jgi:hypothetical protein
MKQPEQIADLAESLLRSGWTVRLRASGSSMKPLLRSGSLLRIAPCTERPSVGDIAFFRAASGRLVAHRVLACDGSRVWTKGDSSGEPDGHVEVSGILGRVLGIERPFFIPLFIPLTGRLARRIGLALNRYYPKLVQLKRALCRQAPRAPRLAREG